MRHSVLMLLFLILSFIPAKGQFELAANFVVDTTKENNSTFLKLLEQSIIPLAIIGVGSVLSEEEFERKIQRRLRNRVGNDFNLPLDDYFQYVPIVEIYAGNLLGIPAQNHWFDQTKYLFISNILTSAITHGLKRVTGKERPSGSKHAFPSGHTSFAFTNASVLYHEYKASAPLFAYSGYAFSTTTAIFRMLNNKHWISDVLAGAGIGMLVTEFVYHFKPFRQFNPFQKSQGLSIVPIVESGGFRCFVSFTIGSKEKIEKRY